jgi:hypothetical protein
VIRIYTVNKKTRTTLQNLPSWTKRLGTQSPGTWRHCTIGSSDFGTLTYRYFKQIWIAVKILRSNYKIRFSLYLAISSENGIFGFKKVRSSLYEVRHFFSWNRSIWVSKEPYFHADFKNVNIPLWQNAPKKSYFRITEI